MTYTCEGCNEEFTGTADEAFKSGWDTPERFVSHCTCSECTVDQTAWWRIVIEKQPPTEDDLRTIQRHNEVWREAQEDAETSDQDG